LEQLTRRNAALLSTGRDFNVHMTRLIEAIVHHVRSLPLQVTHENAAERLIRTFKPSVSLFQRVAGSYQISSVALSPDARFAVSCGGDDGTIKLWEVATGTQIRGLVGHSGGVECLAFSPDGGFVLSGGRDHTMRLWEMTSGREVRTFLDGPMASFWKRQWQHDFYSGWANCLAFSPNGELAVSGGDSNVLKLWEISSGRKLREFQGHTESVMCVAFSPDGDLAISGSFDKTIRMWDVKTGCELRSFAGHERLTSALVFLLNGQILSSSYDRTLKLWDSATCKELHSFVGHAHVVTTLAASVDGRFALSGSWDKTLKLWEVATGKCIHTFTGHTKKVWSVALSFRRPRRPFGRRRWPTAFMGYRWPNLGRGHDGLDPSPLVD
jgi:WD40 repeat protein